MAGPYANAKVAVLTGGLLYSDNVLLPAAEGDITSLGAMQDWPVPVPYGAAVVAEVALSVQGSINSNTSYVVLQSGMGDGNWYDLAWCAWTGVTDSTLFLLYAGIDAAGSFQQSRATGTAPTPANGGNSCPLLGQIRFVGKSTVNATGSSSSSAGGTWIAPGVRATVRVKIRGLR